MSEITPNAIHPLGETKHYKIEGMHHCKNLLAKVYPAHKERGLRNPPKHQDYTQKVNQNQDGDRWPCINWRNVRDDISDWAFWAAQFIGKEVDIRVDTLVKTIQNVNDRAEGNFEAHRQHINKLGPKLSDAISKIPSTVLQSEKFLTALQQIKENREETEELKFELTATKEELADLKSQFAALKAIVDKLNT